MATAQATTNELGSHNLWNQGITIGLSGHGGKVGSIYSDYKKKAATAKFKIERLYEVERLSPAAYNELLKILPVGAKAKSEIAYIVKNDKDGKSYHSELGKYISFTLEKKKISVLIKGHSCLFFVNDKRVTYFKESLKC